MDDFRIDSHKLIFHVERLAQWLKGKPVCPLYLEIAPSGGCNHRCIFCALDYLMYKPQFLDTGVLLSAVKQAAKIGVKSIMYAGEGEPLLHKDIADIIGATKKAGIDVSVTTNGVLLTKELARKILKSLSWIRISLNAGSPATYGRIHRTQPADFERVLGNLRDAVAVKRKMALTTTIGVQFLLIPENVDEVLLLAGKLKKIGIDYFTVKPYSQHPLSGSHIDGKFRYGRYLEMGERLRRLEDKNFKVAFRNVTMRRLEAVKDYRRCLGLPFWAYINAAGDVYACSAFLDDRNFCFGNIYREDFASIIRGRRRREVLGRVSATLDVARCRQACRLDKINSYLWELKHPGPHVNFI